MPRLRLYTSPSAFPNPQRLRLFMHEKGIADQFDETVYDMAPGGEQRKWPHLKMNPWGETPTLVLEDGNYLSETAAIARYFDQHYAGRKIMKTASGHTFCTASSPCSTSCMKASAPSWNSRTTRPGASIAARKHCPMRGWSTAICPTDASGCWAAMRRHSPTLPCARQLLFQSFRSMPRRWTSVSSSWTVSGSAGKRVRHFRPRMPMAIAALKRWRI